MREELNREKMHKAIDTTLSGLNGDPWLFRRISARAAEGEPKVKKRLSVGLVLAIVVLLIAAVAAAVTLLSKQEIVQNVMEEKAVQLALQNDTGTAINEKFSAEELAELIRELNENGFTLDEDNVIMQLIRNGQGYYEEEAIMEICRQAFGGNMASWTLEQQDWYIRLMVKIGFLESYDTRLPGEGNRTYEEAEAFAFRKIREEYGEDLPLEDRSIWVLERQFYIQDPDDPDTAKWDFWLEPRDMEHGRYYISFRDNDPEGTADVWGSVQSWTESYTGEELLGDFWSVYGPEGKWTQETWQKMHEMAQDAQTTPGSWDEQILKAYRITEYPDPGENDISREDAILKAQEALAEPRAALNGAALTEYEGKRQWMVSFIIYPPEDGMEDDAAGTYAAAVDSVTGEVLSVRRPGNYDTTAFAWVPEAAYNQAWEGLLRGDDIIRIATEAALPKYPEMDLENEEKYEIRADFFKSWYVTFRARDVHLGNVTIEVSGEGEILNAEAEPAETDGDSLWDRYWDVYGYFGQWDQAVWVQLDRDMAGMEPEQLEGKLLKAARYPEESTVTIHRRQAEELGIKATGKRLAEVNTCVLVDADPHPVWIMRILTSDDLNPVIGIDAETGENVFTEQFKVDYTPHYVLYSLPQTWRKAELETLGAPYMAKVAVNMKFADMSLDEPDIEVDNPEKWETVRDGLTVRFTGRREGMKSYEVELDENGFVLRCEETGTAAAEKN